MHAREIPNLISIGRILLIAPVVWCLFVGRFDYALLLFAVAGFSDALDGFLAKRFGWQSGLGAILDPIADKMLLVSCYVVLVVLDLIPVALTVVVILRDVLIVIGAIVYHYKIEAFDPSPSMISKVNTTFQIMLVIVVVAAQDVLPVPNLLLQFFLWGVWLTTIISGLAYLWVWGKRAHQVRREDINR
ncbi:MAG TPA: CDP-alcohol phosphatidyltransferase family protein [Chromatiaceae bacterium]|nr:CDP-alcohol phosphatidyltransferase family protein [Chromatiaceae bacterium]HIN81764.1 CDP-alcohol phosphatidyltransferase family protein [Chromatiales bacterium]HIA09051.1 CDP-alcohol phosphatidyltransferase family protein [Chromatiaceae bacterium]HIB84594.1 CDP-alcohol phosphatidyltransferase family protein [Chromatiaceae bacterium]HIO14616.1 CDP-alcohol phosphatidyltransferase family protein [Chromatiales bacterium]